MMPVLVKQANGTGLPKHEVSALQAMIEAAMQGDRRSLARTLTALENRTITLDEIKKLQAMGFNLDRLI
jgi:hypothetical protein